MELEFQPLTMMELRSEPGEILDRVSKNGEAFIIEKKGQHKACLVPVSTFLPDIQKIRLNKELDTLREKGEQVKINIAASKELELCFSEKDDIEIKVVLPHGYPNVVPRVYASPIKEGTPHRWRDGSLCIFGAIANWNPGEHDVLYVMKLVREWLSCYKQWKNTGTWGGGE